MDSTETRNNSLSTPLLPIEVYEAILRNLPEDDSKLSTLLTCRLTCSWLKDIAELPHIWEPIYKTHWKYSDKAAERGRRAEFRHDWFKLFWARAQSDAKVKAVVKDIAAHKAGRSDKAQKLADSFQDIRDQLRRMSEAEPPSPDVATHVDRWLQHQYWATEIIKSVQRREAVKRLARLRRGDNMELEEGLSVLSGFFGASYEEIKAKLDTLAEQCKKAISPDPTLEPTAARCIAICAWMRRVGFGPAEGNEYYSLSNHFLHKVLQGRKSLPLTLVAVFVAIARRLGLDAHAVSFPAHVHAWVRVGETNESLAIDVYNSASQTILTAADWDPVLAALGTSAAESPEWISPANTLTMITRAARNIANSLQPHHRARDDQGAERYWNVITSCYAMVTTITYVTFMQHQDPFTELGLHVKERIRHVFPLDVAIVVEQGMLPTLDGQLHPAKRIFQELVPLVRQAEVTPPAKVHSRKDSLASNVSFFVGLVVALFGSGEPYVGVITGWDVDGIYETETHVKSSPADPIYQVTYTTVSSTIPGDSQLRYELQSDVKPFAAPGVGMYWGMFDFVKSTVQDLGKIFRTAVPNKERNLWFVPADDLAAEYPDDTDAGRYFMAHPKGSALIIGTTNPELNQPSSQ